MARHRMTVLLVDQVLPLDFAIPLHVFGREAPELYAVSTATIDGGPVPVAGGTRVLPDGDARLLGTAQTIVVAGRGRGGRPPLGSDDPRAAARGGRAGRAAGVHLLRRLRAGSGRSARRPDRHHPLVS